MINHVLYLMVELQHMKIVKISLLLISMEYILSGLINPPSNIWIHQLFMWKLGAPVNANSPTADPLIKFKA